MIDLKNFTPYTLLLLGGFLLLGSMLSAQAEVQFTNLANSQGKLMIRVRAEDGKVVKELTLPLKNTAPILKLDLSPAKYAIAVFHDENDNNKLDRQFTGFPAEAYGFSNNVRGTLGPPDLSDQLVYLRRNSQIKIKLE